MSAQLKLVQNVSLAPKIKTNDQEMLWVKKARQSIKDAPISKAYTNRLKKVSPEFAANVKNQIEIKFNEFSDQQKAFHADQISDLENDKAIMQKEIDALRAEKKENNKSLQDYKGFAKILNNQGDQASKYDDLNTLNDEINQSIKDDKNARRRARTIEQKNEAEIEAAKNNIKYHIRSLAFMGGVARDRQRVKETEECFTPSQLCIDIINHYERVEPNIFKDASKTVLDPTCGDGQFLGEALIRKVENGIDFETALSTIYGCDLMPDNVALCQERLLCGHENLRHIVEKNIVCADGLRYHYRFDNSPLYDKSANEYQDELFNSLFTVK